LRIALRQAPSAPRLSCWEKVTLAALAARCRDLTDALVLVRPATVLRWHRAIVTRKWTYGNTPKRGRPTIPAATVDLIVRFARENRAWGYGKLQAELLKVGHRVSRATLKRILRRQGLPPAPRRRRTTWRAFLAQHRSQLLDCDFFTVDTLLLQRLYVLFFVELGSRRLYLASCTAHPTAARVTQQARNLCWRLQEGAGQTPVSSFAIVMGSSPPASTRSSPVRASPSSRRRPGRRTPTPSQSASSAPSARNAWTRCSSSIRRIYGLS
jgi:transposase